MRTKKTVDVPAQPATTKTVEVWTCDLCGIDLDKQPEPDCACSSSVTVQALKHGYDGDYDALDYEVCLACFETKVAGWFAAQGVQRKWEHR